MTSTVLSDPESAPRVLLWSAAGSVFLHGLVLMILTLKPVSTPKEITPTRVQVRLVAAPSQEPNPEPSMTTPPVPALPSPPIQPVKPTQPPVARLQPKAEVVQSAPPLSPTLKSTPKPDPVQARKLMKMVPASQPTPRPSTYPPGQRSLSTPVPPPATAPKKLHSRLPALTTPPINLPKPTNGRPPISDRITTRGPALITTSEPVYPLVARNEGWEGTVVIRTLIDPEGRPTALSIHKSSGFSVLDQSAIESVQTWKFSPAKDGNIPFAKWVNIPVKFSLQEKNAK